MRAITVIGPSQSGKSTLTSAMASLDGARSRKLSLAGDVALTAFDYMGEAWAALDVPGGFDNMGYIGPLLAVSDAAVLCMPAEVQAAVLSAPFLRLLEESGVPAFVFLNKLDSTQDRVSDVVAALQNYCAHALILRQIPIRTGERIAGAIDLISERAWQYREGERSLLVKVPESMVPREEAARFELLEALADFDDALLEQIVEDQRPSTDDVYAVATRVLQHHDLVPVFLGAASHANGVQRLMKSLRHEAPSSEALRDRDGAPADVIAASCAGDFVRHLGKVVVLRALGKELTPSLRLCGDRIGGLVDMDLKTPLSSVPPGSFAVAVKSDHVPIGAYLIESGSEPLPAWSKPHAPCLTRVVRPVHERDDSKLSGALEKLKEIDPALWTGQDAAGGELKISTQGVKHLQRIVDAIEKGFGIEVTCAEPPPPLKETIRGEISRHCRHKKQSGGAGQFADVVITVRAQPMGSGFQFDETVKGGAVPRNYIPAVAEGAAEALATGPAGHPVVDVSVVLTDGKAHSVDSSDFAFRTAGRIAVKEALAEIGTIVLQPIHMVEINVPSVFAGDLVQLVSGLKGQILGFEAADSAAPGWDNFRALLPMAALDEALHALGATTRGTAWMTTEFDHYEELRDELAAR
jgi:elongation factor G